MTGDYPFYHHPCWAQTRVNLWERIHLPIAPLCNLQCNFCDHATNTCHTFGPGVCERLMGEDDAWRVLQKEAKNRQNLHIIGISGPGEPLYNVQVFSFLERIQNSDMYFRICLSTNGVLLAQKAGLLKELGADVVSVSMSTIIPDTCALIYKWANVDGEILTGRKMGELIVSRQLEGIREATSEGIRVKVNSILIPAINTSEMSMLAEAIADSGALLQNIVPLTPRGEMTSIRRPTTDEIDLARRESAAYIQQFVHCRQCRSDVVGIPGCDSVLALE
jgi:nitrogen fixation protein NifB